MNDDAQLSICQKFALPTLPSERHQTPSRSERDSSTSLDNVLYRAYDDSLSCVSCHTFKTEHDWPALAGYNNRTGNKVKSWPTEWDLEFNLEVRTQPGQKGLPDIANASNNHFYYKWDSTNPKALNRHQTCPLFKQYACDIHHRVNGIWVVLNPFTPQAMCCKAFNDVSVVPPWWIQWGLYVDTSFMDFEQRWADRFIYGDTTQLDEHGTYT